MARFRGSNALSSSFALSKTSFMSGSTDYFRLLQQVISSSSSFPRHVSFAQFLRGCWFPSAFYSSFCSSSSSQAAAGSIHAALSSSIKPSSVPWELSNPSHTFLRLKRGEFNRDHPLKLLLRGQALGSASAYCTSSVSTSSSRSDSRVPNNPSETGFRKRRFYPLRAYKPSSSAPPGQELPFEYRYSYSEVPKVAPIGYREPPFSPFGPSSMPQPWTGRAALEKRKKKGNPIDSFNPPPPEKKGVKPIDPPGPFLPGQGPRFARTREEVLGEPLTKAEVNELIESCNRESRQINLGRDGLTHNMIEVIHLHWKRRRSIKIRCKGVPTVDMDNVCFHLEDKTGGKIIHRVGGTVHLFRGRNYNAKFRPKLPLMLWKPAAPIYPRLVKFVPDGLTQESVTELRIRGRKVKPLCKLARNGVYLNLVKDVKDAFEVDELVRIDCKGMNPSDYKKIGAKLRDMVPCTLISFEKERILMWAGKDWKPLPRTSDASLENISTSTTLTAVLVDEPESEKAHDLDAEKSCKVSVNASELDMLWEQALDTGAASLLDEKDESDRAHILTGPRGDAQNKTIDQRASTPTLGDLKDNSAASPNALTVEELSKLLTS